MRLEHLVPKSRKCSKNDEAVSRQHRSQAEGTQMKCGTIRASKEIMTATDYTPMNKIGNQDLI